MISVGITGGIGSGKTLVCNFFEILNVPVYYADDRAKFLMNSDEDIKQGIKNAFGPDAYDKNGKLNRAFLANQVFNNKEKLEKLNSLVHPAVWNDTSKWMQSNADEPYVLYEAAILFESGSYKMLNKVITVYAPKETRIKRVVARDKTNIKEVQKRIDNQMSYEEKIAKSDYVVYNDGSQELISQILNIHKELINS